MESESFNIRASKLHTADYVRNSRYITGLAWQESSDVAFTSAMVGLMVATTLNQNSSGCGNFRHFRFESRETHNAGAGQLPGEN